MSELYIISGDDDFARKRHARDTAAQLCNNPEPENDECVEIIPGDSATLKVDDLAALFVEALRTPPFLCERKIIWMRHHPDLEKLTADKPSAAYAELFSLLSAPLPPEIDVLIDGPGLDRRRARAKDEQVPTEEKQYLLKFKDGTIDVLYVGIDGNLEPFILTRECFEFYKDVEKWCEIPKESVK